MTNSPSLCALVQARDPELLHHARLVNLDGARADVEALGDRGIAHAARHHPGDLALARRQRQERAIPGVALAGLGDARGLARERRLDRDAQLVIVEGLLEEVDGVKPERRARGSNVAGTRLGNRACNVGNSKARAEPSRKISAKMISRVRNPNAVPSASAPATSAATACASRTIWPRW